jgi:hypothetical protein
VEKVPGFYFMARGLLLVPESNNTKPNSSGLNFVVLAFPGSLSTFVMTTGLLNIKQQK